MQNLRRTLFSSLLLMFLLPALLFAADPETAPKPVKTPKLPASIEIIPRLGTLNEKITPAKNQLTLLNETTPISKALDAARQAQQRLDQSIAEMEAEGWNYDRLLTGREAAETQKTNLAKQQEALSVKLKELDALRQSWQEQQLFWTNWKLSAPPDLHQDQKESFIRAEKVISDILAEIVESGKPLVALQTEVLQLQQQNQLSLGSIDEKLQVLRGNIFEKTEKSLTNPGFYRQLNWNLMTDAGKNLRQFFSLDKDFFQEKGWILAFQFLLAFVLAGYIIIKRHKTKPSDEWHFILQHPFATGLFVAVATLSFLYGALPGSLRLLLVAVAVFSTAILVSEFLKDRVKILMIYLMALLFIVATALQSMALPTPLYRLYLILVSLLGVPFLLLLARRTSRNRIRKTNGFIISLRLGAAILFLVFLTQFGGFANLSSKLLESSNNTIFLGLFAAMAVRLGWGALDYIFGQPFFRRESFFNQFGGELVDQLKGLLRLFIGAYTLLYLLVIWGWGFFDTPREAWATLMQLGITFGETRVTAHMVLLALGALYVTIRLSWLIRALLESEFFPRSAMDRGIRDSIKKLLHYALVLIGFTIALSLLGVTMQNFVIIGGAFGIGIGFGLQNIVSNFVSGLILLFERPIKVGDMIMLDSEWAIVRSIGLRSTTIETFDLSEIIVPNSDLVSQKVTNWTLSNEQSRVVVPVGVAYGSDVALVLSLLKGCAEKHPKVLDAPIPSVIFVAFGDSSLDFELRAWVANVKDRLSTRSDLLQAIDAEFRKANVEIPFPQRDLHLRSIDSSLLNELAKDPKISQTEPVDSMQNTDLK